MDRELIEEDVGPPARRCPARGRDTVTQADQPGQAIEVKVSQLARYLDELCDSATDLRRLELLLGVGVSEGMALRDARATLSCLAFCAGHPATAVLRAHRQLAGVTR